MESKTPLYEKHLSTGGKIVSFAGFLLPVQYSTGIILEHNAVRQKAGLFDVSHMGEILIEGPGALYSIQNLLTNDFTGLSDGKMRYSLMCNQNGGIIDDVIVYRHNSDRYMIVVNAANTSGDFEWISRNITNDVACSDISSRYAQLALQGPFAKKILLSLPIAESDIPSQNYTFKDNTEIEGINCLLSASGYTGEEGFEIYTAPENATCLWDRIIEAGKPYGMIPCGLGARDTLRLEACMPLYGHELSVGITPFEAQLGRYVRMDKPDFIGKSSLVSCLEPKRLRVGVEMVDRGIARENYTVFSGADIIGETTSGTFCPFIEKSLAMAIVKREFSFPGTEIEIDIRGRRSKAKVVPMPFYKRKSV